MTIYEDANVRIYEDAGDTLRLDKLTGETRMATEAEREAAWNAYTGESDDQGHARG